MEEHYEQIRCLLTNGCSETEFSELHCPVCGGGLAFVVHPNGRRYFVRCEASSTHLSMHGENLNSPVWWRSHVRTGGWTG